MKIRQIARYWVKSPLTVPDRLSYRTFGAFEPILVEAVFGKPLAAARAAE